MIDSIDRTSIYHATIESPLGTVMLCASSNHLVGLYFTDQKDCPQAPGKQAPSAESLDPTSGLANGLALRRFSVGNKKAVPPAYLPGIELAGGDGVGGQDGGMALPLSLPENTPASVQAIFTQTQAELVDYFLGKPLLFSTPLAFKGTDYQRKVWQALLAIPYGAVASYADVALAAGLTAGHGRAVGTAVGRNPIAIIVPCHRVLSASHTLAGYTGGLSRKAALLQLEGHSLQPQS